MSGSAHPLTLCDAMCARANRCQVGGLQCNECGRYFCIEDLNADGFCEDCAEAIAQEEFEAEMEVEP